MYSPDTEHFSFKLKLLKKLELLNIQKAFVENSNVLTEYINRHDVLL